jgi:hypothetical protein
MPTLTIKVDNVSEDFLTTIWSAATRQSPIPMRQPPDRENIHFDFPEMDNALAKPLAEMLILAVTMAAIIQYQKENN